MNFGSFRFGMTKPKCFLNLTRDRIYISVMLININNEFNKNIDCVLHIKYMQDYTYDKNWKIIHVAYIACVWRQPQQ